MFEGWSAGLVRRVTYLKTEARTSCSCRCRLSVGCQQVTTGWRFRGAGHRSEKPLSGLGLDAHIYMTEPAGCRLPQAATSTTSDSSVQIEPQTPCSHGSACQPL